MTTTNTIKSEELDEVREGILEAIDDIYDHDEIPPVITAYLDIDQKAREMQLNLQKIRIEYLGKILEILKAKEQED